MNFKYRILIIGILMFVNSIKTLSDNDESKKNLNSIKKSKIEKHEVDEKKSEIVLAQDDKNTEKVKNNHKNGSLEGDDELDLDSLSAKEEELDTQEEALQIEMAQLEAEAQQPPSIVNDVHTITAQSATGYVSTAKKIGKFFKKILPWNW